MLFKSIPTPINSKGMATTNSGCTELSLCKTLAACGSGKREGLQDREVSAYNSPPQFMPVRSLWPGLLPLARL